MEEITIKDIDGKKWVFKPSITNGVPSMTVYPLQEN